MVGLLLWLSMGFGFSQSREIDSLKHLSKLVTGKNKVDVLNKLAFEIFPFDQTKFLETTSEALRLSDELHYQKGKIETLIYVAANQSDVGENVKSIQGLKECVQLSTDIHDRGLEGFALKQLGSTHENLDQWDSAIYYYRRSYELLKDSINPLYLSIVYIGLADYYGFKNQYQNQLTYLNRCYQIRKAFKGTSRVWISIALASFYSDRNEYTMSLRYLDNAQHILGKDTVQNELISAVNSQRAIVFFKNGNYATALNLLNEAHKFYEARSYKRELTNLLLTIGQTFDNMGNYEASLKNYFEALPLASKNNFKFEQTKLEYSIAWAYFRLRQYKIAEDYARKAIESSEKNKHKTELGASLNIMGLVADSQNRSEEALFYLNQALAIRKNLGDSLKIAGTLFNIGSVFEKIGDLKQALSYQLKSLAIQEFENNAMGMAYSYQKCGSLFIKLHEFKKAVTLLEKAEKIAVKIKARTILIDVYRSQVELFTAESKLEKALAYSALYQNLKDSAFDENMSNRIGVLEKAHQLQEQENQIRILSQEKKLQQGQLTIQNAQIKQQGTIIIFSIAGLLLVGVAAFLFFLYNKKLRSLNHKVFEKNEEISAQAEELTESNATISRINAELEERIEIRTAELKQAYKELDIFFYRSSHDFRRPLTTFMGLAEVAKITVKDGAALELFEKVNQTARSLDRMLSKLQSVSDVGIQQLIYTQVFVKDIFELELNNFKEELNRVQIEVTVSVVEQKPLYSYPALIAIIVRNLLENAIAFCNKPNSQIHLRSFEKKNEIIIEVQDSGQGIKPEYLDRVFEMYFRGNESSKGNGLGLYIVKKTVQKLSGRIEINSVFDAGTTVRVVLPNQQD